MLGKLWIHIWDFGYLFQKFHLTFIGRISFWFVCLFSSENGHSYFEGVPDKVAMMRVFAPWKFGKCHQGLSVFPASAPINFKHLPLY